VNPSHATDIYPDLLDDESDAAVKGLVGHLANIYRGVDAPVALRRSLEGPILASVKARQDLLARRKVRSRFSVKIGALMAAAALVLIVGVVGYAVAPLVDQLLAGERGAATLPMHAIGQTQTTNGITVTLDRAYADVNRVIVVYKIQVPAGFAHSTSGIDHKIQLTDTQGSTLPLIDASGLADEASHLSTGLVTFDAESLASGTDLTGKLTFLDVRARAQQLGGRELSAGAFTFTFSVPVASGREVTVSKTVVQKGVAVTLERVVITPSETRAYLRFPADAGIPDSGWSTYAHMSGSGWDSRQLPAFKGLITLGSSFMNGRGEHVQTFSGDFSGRHGEWTFTVDALFGSDTTVPNDQNGLPKQARIEGPWTFKFSL
jgi:hypothetical protein